MPESLFDHVRQAEIFAPDEDSITRFAPYVSITPEARDALVTAVMLLMQLNHWDALNPPTVTPYGDAPYFKAEIEHALRSLGCLT